MAQSVGRDAHRVHHRVHRRRVDEHEVVARPGPGEGGGEKKTLRIVARPADIWHSFSTPAVLEHKLGVLSKWCDTVGRDLSEIEISTELRARTVTEADELYDLGARLFTLGLSGPHYDLASLTDWLAWRDTKNALETGCTRDA